MKYAIHVNESAVEVDVTEGDNGKLRVTYDGKTYELDFHRSGSSPLYSLIVDGTSYEVYAEPNGRNWMIGIDSELFETRTRPGALRAGEAEEAGGAAAALTVLAPMTGVVGEVRCHPGQSIEKGDVLVVIEAMKMNNEIRATRSGEISDVFVTPGQRVDHRAPLLALAATSG